MHTRCPLIGKKEKRRQAVASARLDEKPVSEQAHGSDDNKNALKKKRDVFSGTHKIALLTVLCLVVLSKALTISHFACMCVFIRILYVLKYTFFFSEWGRQRNSFRTYHFWEEKKKTAHFFFFFFASRSTRCRLLPPF